ncbi:MAG: Zn-dependent alcohol dehydrogenase [Caldilineaceae bacterium]|nr:Zn-dependent alcohol dehydrogenase [Caldilineaceae bacterium]
MKIRAAYVPERNKLIVSEVVLDPPKAGELLVRIRAAGVCHSDLHTLKGELRTMPPLVLGHEGAGIVEEVGPGVTRFAVGDRVLVNWLPACHICTQCQRGRPNLCERLASTTYQGAMIDGTSRLHSLAGESVKQYLSASTMADYAVIPQDGAVLLQEGVPFEVGAVIGCAVITGVGAVINTAKARPGSSAAVIGCGGIGLSAILGCVVAGCHTIVAVDVFEEKLAFARQMGATHTINARNEEPVKALKAITGGGPDYAFDSVGSARTIPQALNAAGPAGVATVMGLHSALEDVPISAGQLIFQNKSLLGSFAGSARPDIDLPNLQRLYLAGKLDLDKLITKRYPLDDIALAFEDMEAGRVARGVLVFD